MAPNESVVEWQTSEIIKYLFLDEVELQCREAESSALQTDGPTGCSDDFDPVLIADKLRSVADAMNDDLTLKGAMNDLRKAVVQEVAEAAFSHAVETICQSQVSRSAEVVSEMQLIRASVAFGLYVLKSSPDLKNKVQGAMTAFLNRRVRTWVTQQGGWDKVDI